MINSVENFPLTVKSIKDGIAQKLHTCAQVHIRQYGEIIADFAIGEIEPGRPCTPKTIMPWMSCTKMITALAFGILVDRGRTHFTENVAAVIPEFANNGKKDITFANILDHTAGIRLLSAKWDNLTWEESIDAVCAMHVEENWKIGSDGGYHIAASWFILGEAIQRLSSMRLADFVEMEILKPLEMNNSFIEVTEGNRYKGTRETAGFYISATQNLRPAPDKYINAPNKCRPGASGHGPVRELASFMELLYEGGCIEERRIISENTLNTMVSPHRTGVVDKTFGKIIDWGLGFMIDSKKYQQDYPYSFGLGASSETFGHNGNQSSAAYVDPDEELVISFAFNGLPGEVKHQKRLAQINAAIYHDLGIL